MFWFGLLLAFLGGLLSISLIRKYLRRYVTTVKDIYLDVILIIFVIFGLGISAYVHVGEDKEREELYSTIEVLQEYSDVAQLNIKGNFCIGGGGVCASTRISALLQEVFTGMGNKIYWKCDPKTLAKFRIVTERHSKFPFSHYTLAECLRKDGDETWRNHARKAVEILEKTTSLAGRHGHHDVVLKELRSYLE